MTILSLPNSSPVSELDEMEHRLRAGGWAQKPAPMSDFDEEQRAMASALSRDWGPPKPKPRVYEWWWFANTLGRRWQIAEVIDGRRFLTLRGFTTESLSAQIKALRRSGCIVREAVVEKAAA